MSQKHFSDGSGLQVSALDLAGTLTIGTFPVTATGFSGIAPTGTVRFLMLGDLVVMSLPAIVGTSNSAGFTLLSVPAGLRPTLPRQFSGVYVIDQAKDVVGTIVFEVSGVISLYSGVQSDPFKTSSTKGFGPLEVHYLR